MRIWTNDMFFSVLAFLTVNSVVSLLKTIVCVGLPFVAKRISGNCYDLEPMYNSAENFNIGIVDRIKRRAYLRENRMNRARGVGQAVVTWHLLPIILVIILIVGAEVGVLFMLRPRRYELRSSQVQLGMHNVVKAIDRSRKESAQDVEKCDIVKNQVSRDSQTLLWESKVCAVLLLRRTSVIEKELARAANEDDKFRFVVAFPKDSGNEENGKRNTLDDFVMWLTASSSEIMYVGSHAVFGLPLGADIETELYIKVPTSLLEEMLRFSFARKFGKYCSIEKHKWRSKRFRLVNVECDRKVGSINQLWIEWTKSGLELFERTGTQIMHRRKEKGMFAVRGDVYDPVVQILYGLNLTSWRLILLGFLIGISIITTTIRTWSTKEVSYVALNDLLRRSAFKDYDVLPFSGPRLETKDELIDKGESFRLELKSQVHPDIDAPPSHENLRTHLLSCLRKSFKTTMASQRARI